MTGDRSIDVFRFSLRYIRTSSVRLVISVKGCGQYYPPLCEANTISTVVELRVSKLIPGPHHARVAPQRGERRITSDHVFGFSP